MSNHSELPPGIDLDMQEALRKLAANQGVSFEALCAKLRLECTPGSGQEAIRAEVIKAFDATTQEFASLYEALAR